MSDTRISYAAGITHNRTDSDLQDLLEPHGRVQSAQVVMDRDAGRSKGFGFVEMEVTRKPKRLSRA